MLFNCLFSIFVSSNLCLFPILLFPSEIRVAPPDKASCDSVALSNISPNYLRRLNFYRSVACRATFPCRLGIFNVHTPVAHGTSEFRLIRKIGTEPGPLPRG